LVTHHWKQYNYCTNALQYQVSSRGHFEYDDCNYNTETEEDLRVILVGSNQHDHATGFTRSYTQPSPSCWHVNFVCRWQLTDKPQRPQRRWQPIRHRRQHGFCSIRLLDIDSLDDALSSGDGYGVAITTGSLNFIDVYGTSMNSRRLRLIRYLLWKLLIGADTPLCSAIHV
jgi:hypothetical protein